MKRLALLLMIALASAGAAAAGGIEPEIPAGKAAVVVLKVEAEVLGGEIRLGEIAEVAAREPWLKERLEELTVGSAPLPGTSRRLSVGAINLRLRQARLPADEIVLQAPASEVQVTTLAQRVAKEAIAEAVEAWYRSSLRLPAGSLLHLEVRASDETAPVGRVELRPVDAEPRWGKAAVPFELIVDGKPYRRVSVTVEAAIEQDVWIAARDILRLEEVGPGDVYLERRRLASPVEVFDFTKPLRATRYVRKGTVLTSREIEAVPDLLRGELVLIVAEVDGVVVRAIGESMAEARIGETVPVKNLSSGQVVYGTLTEEKYVAVRVW